MVKLPEICFPHVPKEKGTCYLLTFSSSILITLMAVNSLSAEYTGHLYSVTRMSGLADFYLTYIQAYKETPPLWFAIQSSCGMERTLIIQ